jgi:hypothetical protein
MTYCERCNVHDCGESSCQDCIPGRYIVYATCKNTKCEYRQVLCNQCISEEEPVCPECNGECLIE